MKSFLLTLDYELYGNGSGDVFQHMIEPTKHLLDIAEQYNVRFTFFFEVIEYWKLKEEWTKGNTMGYKNNPIEAIEKQLLDAYKAGHDIQLHLHPQWVDAYWDKNKWNINLKEWRLGSYERDGEYSLVNLLKKGKNTIEGLIQQIDPTYKCIALRAGGYNIQPSENIVSAMGQTELVIDSSIYPGGREIGFLSNYDYSNIPTDLEYWQVENTLEQSGNKKIWELPIVAFPIIRWTKYLSIERIKSLFQNRKSAKDAFEAKTSGIHKGKLDKVKYFFEKEYQTWDYCLFSSMMHRKYLSLIALQDRNIFVLVGHPKSFVSSGGLEYLLSETNSCFKYQTITEIYRNDIKE